MSQEMRIAKLKKINETKAEQLSCDITLGDDAMLLINDNISPEEFLEKLIYAKHYQDAIKFLARALPAREAAWWACVSARYCINEDSAEADIQALELAEKWVFKPSEENRYKAHEAVEIIENDSPIHWAGMAVLWSGGSIAPPDVPEVPAAPNLCGLAVSGAVILAGLSDDVEEAAHRYQLFLKQGFAIANGENAKEVH